MRSPRDASGYPAPRSQATTCITEGCDRTYGQSLYSGGMSICSSQQVRGTSRHSVLDVDSPFGHLIQKQISGDITFLQHPSALGDCTGSKHLYDDGGGKCGGS